MTAVRRFFSGLAEKVGALAISLLAMMFGALLGAKFLPACGLDVPFWGTLSWCVADNTATAAEAAYLRSTIRSLESQLAARVCEADAPEQRAAAQPTPPLPEVKRCSMKAGDANVVVVLDGSSSMLMPLATDPDEEKALSVRAQKGDIAAGQALKKMEGLPGLKRIDAARNALNMLFEQLPPERRVGIGFSDCRALTEFKGALAIEQVGHFRPQGKTPIALAVLRAAKMLDPSRPGNVVLVSDGNDTCGGDVCQAANTIKAELPLVNINVVDLAGWTDVSCLATRTGGRYMRYESGIDISDLVAEQALTREVCE